MRATAILPVHQPVHQPVHRPLEPADPAASISVRISGRTAVLSPTWDTRASGPSAGEIGRLIDRVEALGVVDAFETAAVTSSEATVFRAAGFSLERELELLIVDLASVVMRPRGLDRAGRLRSVALRDVEVVVDVDHRAFDPHLRLDGDQLTAAYLATPSSRLRAARRNDGTISGYALVGRAGARGYVQRLAVDPSEQGQGIGRALLLDGLRWCARHRVQRAVVNTDLDNHPALHLYRSTGFTSTGERLVVLRRPATPATNAIRP